MELRAEPMEVIVGAMEADPSLEDASVEGTDHAQHPAWVARVRGYRLSVVGLARGSLQIIGNEANDIAHNPIELTLLQIKPAIKM